MYSTCLFCHADLGANEVIESFPVGRRLAFDAAKGRLWVVCRKCERWNLTPLEERWEAIEQCERAFRDTRLRVSTDNIGLARVKEGLELVRVGAPQRPEMAAWRYGDQFGRRRRRTMLTAGAGLGALALVVGGGIAAGVGIGGFAWSLGRMVTAAVRGDPDTVVARVQNGRELIRIKRRELERARLLPSADGASLDLVLIGGKKLTARRLTGVLAERVIPQILPQANRWGGSRATIQQAVTKLEASGGPDRFIGVIGRRDTHDPAALRLADVADGDRVPLRRWRSAQAEAEADAPAGRFARWLSGPPMLGLDTVDRLALEMALHEEQERRALEGELATLEAAWRAAEEIAAIADDMFVDEGIVGRLKAMRGKG